MFHKLTFDLNESAQHHHHHHKSSSPNCSRILSSSKDVDKENEGGATRCDRNMAAGLQNHNYQRINNNFEAINSSTCHRHQEDRFARRYHDDKENDWTLSSGGHQQLPVTAANHRRHRRKCTVRPLQQQHRLVDKGQRRSLHDLSCQFGTKGFTKEMRQIAGGSQSGLRKFLSQYPSLFTIDGDYVSITCYTNDNGKGNGTSGDAGGGGVGGRNYTQEAVEYFQEKLEQYGAAEVPIKSLLGHRSQAPLEVRHVSGQHIREFRDFLAKFPEVFVVRDEYVVLTKHWEAIGEGGANEGGTLERRETLPSGDDAFVTMPSQHESQLTSQIVAFCRTMIENRGPLPMDNLFAQLTFKFPRETWSCLVKNIQDFNVLLKMYSDTFLVQGGMVSLVPAKHSPSVISPCANSSAIGPVSSSSSRHGGEPPTERTQGDSTPTSRSQPPALMSFKQRLMSHLIKAVADNTAMEQRVYQSPSAPAAGHHRGGGGGGQVPSPPTNFDVAQTSARLLKAVKIVTNIRDCQAVTARLRQLQPPVVSFDAEGVNLGPSGPMTLVQIGTPDGQIYIFDLVVCKELVGDGGLRELLESGDVMKVVHDCRNDSAALHHQFGVSLNNVFDTQAAHAILQQQLTGKPVHKVKNISLNTVCRMYGGPVNPKKEQMKKLYRRDQRFWSRRPLTDDMVLYAAYDIWALVPTVFENMRQQLDGGEHNLLFRQLCAEQVDTYVRVEEVKQSKKQRKIEAEVADLKKKLALSGTNKTVVLSNREIRLLRHVDLTDEERDKLEGSYKVARKLERLQGRGVSCTGATGVASGDRSNADSSEASPEIDDDDEYDVDDFEVEKEEGDDEEDEEEEEEEEDLEFADDDGVRSFYSLGKSSSPSLEESIRLVEQFLANERLENLGLDDLRVPSSNGTCMCACHCQRLATSSVPAPDGCRRKAAAAKPSFVESGCQTLSTGDIVITKVYFEDKGNSPKFLGQRECISKTKEVGAS